MRGRVRDPAAFCCWAAALTVFLPALLLHSLDVRVSAALALQCVAVIHSGGALARVLTDPAVRVVAFGFWLFSYVWLGLAPLAMLATDRYPRGFLVDARTSFLASALIEIGLLAYSAGSALSRGRAGNTGSGFLEPLLARRVAPVRVLLLCGLALALALVLVPRQGGLDAFFASRQAANEAATGTTTSTDSAGRALAAWGLSVPAFWALVCLVHVPRLARGDRVLRGLRWMLLPALVALNVVVNNPISQPRFWAGTVLLTVLFATPAAGRPRVFRAGAAAITLTVLVVFPYSDYFRYDQREPVHVVSLTEQFTTNGDYDAYQQIQTGVAFTQKQGLSPTRAIGPPLFFVPRTVWPGKPDDAGIVLARHAGYSFDNLSAPLWVESYMWAGPPSLIAVFAALGAIGRRIDQVRGRLRAERGTLAALLIPGLAFYQLIVLRGSLMACAGPLFLLLAIPLCVATRRSQGRSTTRGSSPDRIWRTASVVEARSPSNTTSRGPVIEAAPLRRGGPRP